MLRYFVFIGGGSGVAPLQSICNFLLMNRTESRPHQPSVKRIIFLGSFGQVDEILAFFEPDRQWAGPLNRTDDATSVREGVTRRPPPPIPQKHIKNRRLSAIEQIRQYYNNRVSAFVAPDLELSQVQPNHVRIAQFALKIFRSTNTATRR